jgi:hypothetical protein
VVDFGIAHAEGANATRLTQTGAAIGTPAYMPPEQLLGMHTDARADIYALGVVIMEMLAGRHPLSAERRMMTPSDSVSPPCEIAWRCTRPDRGERYQSAVDVLGALERELEHRTDPAASEHRVESARSDSSHWWWQFHQAAAALVYGLMTWPAWNARSLLAGKLGDAVFLATLAAAIVAGILRLHLWFTSRSYPAELAWARTRAAVWVAVADVVFTGALIVAGALVGESRPELAVMLIAVGVGVAVAFLLIEPATARAAFHQDTKP